MKTEPNHSTTEQLSTIRNPNAFSIQAPTLVNKQKFAIHISYLNVSYPPLISKIFIFFKSANGSVAENGDANGDANGESSNGHSNDASEKSNDAEKSKTSTKTDNGNVIRISTRQWVMDSNYDPKQIFAKLFGDDIKYLLSMDKLWAKRRPPVPLDWDDLPGPKSDTVDVGLIRDQQVTQTGSE